MKGAVYLKRVVIILLTLATTLSFPTGSNSQAWWFGKNKVQYKDFHWSILTTPHFDIHFSEGYRDLAARTAVILEYGYGKLSGDFDHQLKWRIPVIIYGSHTDFQQTNTTWQLLPEGVQAFAEPSRRRMVLHFSGSNVDFSHTAIHELVHIFQFDIIYGNLLRSVFSRSFLFRIPLWFAEGMAEYYSIGGMDDECEMFMRDGTIFDYLPFDLAYAGGYMNYKAGQSAIDYICRTYGNEKIVELMDQLRYQRSLEIALQNSIGLTTQQLTQDWKKDLRKRYWPVYAGKEEPDFFGRQLTDHMKKHHYMNSKPVFSPDGRNIVFYSDRSGLQGIYLMNSLTGEVTGKLLSSSMSSEFEYIRTLKSSLSWSPDGKSIVFVAKSDGKDKLFIMKVPGGEILKKIELPLDFFFNPSWSPIGESIAIVGTIDGQTDIYVYNIGKQSLLRVTDDLEDEKYLSWFPGGTRIAYTRFPQVAVQHGFNQGDDGNPRLTGVDFTSMRNLLDVTGDIWSIDLDSGEKELLIATPGNDESPLIISDGKEIIFTSDETGVSNLYRGSLEVGSYYRFTDVPGGIFNPSYSSIGDNLVYSGFNMAGYDLYIMDSFIDKSAVSYSTGSPLMVKFSAEWPSFGMIPSGEMMFQDPGAFVDGGVDEGSIGSLDSGGEDVLEISGSVRVESVGGTPTGGKLPGMKWKIPVETPDVVIEEDSKKDIDPDSLEAMRNEFRKEIGTIRPYDAKFSPDYIGNGMGLFFSTGFGFGLANQIAFSDLLGDHHLFLAFNLFGSIEDSDLMLSYYYVKKRIDYSVGVFQFKNYLNSRFSSIGEAFTDYRFFSERNYGVFGNASFPFSTFTRVELELQAYISEREFLTWDENESYGGYYVPLAGEISTRRLLQPSISLVHDSAYYGSYGPVIGSRWMVSFSRALSFSGDDVSRTTFFADYRKYMPLWYRNYLAFRAVGSVSDGLDKRYFFLGGPLTMRGYDYLQFQGPKMMLFNLEYRYPLVDALIFGWPGRWGFTNVGGTFFFDTGSVWGEDMYVEPLPAGIDAREINGLKFYSDFGMGFYMRFGFLILNFQLAWPTDFSYTGDSVFHFYLGSQF
ncbi:MAG: PD40 domain-containing protein [Candidatus Krumholzibacteria bacterium]|nr:PD40 domain-containing protein [Candidatus Krumholzibacteria bacterium]